MGANVDWGECGLGRCGGKSRIGADSSLPRICERDGGNEHIYFFLKEGVATRYHTKTLTATAQLVLDMNKNTRVITKTVNFRQEKQ